MRRAALITISTRASLKRYHTYTLTLGLPSDSASDPYACTYSLQRIGTAQEKQSVDKELSELRERLSHVEEWTRRRDEIDCELRKVLVGGGEELPPSYDEAAARDELVAETAEDEKGSRDGGQLEMPAEGEDGARIG